MSRKTLLALTTTRSFFVAPVLAFTMTAASVTTAIAAPIAAPVKDPPSDDVARAGELYDNGSGLYKEGSYDGAAMAFIQAYELSGDIDLLYNVSLAYDRAENFEEALRYLEAYRALAPKEERAGLGEKVDSLKVRLERKAEAEANADAAERDAAQSETTTVDEPKESPSTEPLGSGSTSTDDDSGPRVFTPFAGVLTGLAVAGVAAGTVLGVSSRSATSDAQDQCSGALCQTSASSDLDRARGHAIGADIGFGVGAVSALALIVVLAVNASKRKKARANAMLVPSGRGGTFAFSF